MRSAAVVLALLLSASAARAGVLDDLYSKRLLFDAQGRPLVPVGLMEQQARVVLRSEGGITLTLGEGLAPVVVPAGVSVVVEDAGGKPAKVVAWTVLELLDGKDRARRKEVVDRWAARGIPVELVATGGTYGVRGTVVDNRALLVVVKGAFPPELAQRYAVRPDAIERQETLPIGKMRVTIGAEPARSAPFVRAARTGEQGVTVERVEHSRGYQAHGFEDRSFRGDVLVVPDPKAMLAVVNLVHEDVLVAGILPSEMFASAPLEALKAQAVTARGELFAKIGRRHFKDPFLVCSEQHCQVYKGVSAETAATNRAALETAGELAFDGDELVDSVYSACCGGHTEPADVVWDRPKKNALTGTVDAPWADPSTRPWLDPAVQGSALLVRAAHDAGAGPVVPLDLRTDDAVRALLALPREATFCGKSTFNQKGDAYRWQRRFTREELDAAFADLGVGTVRRLVVEERGPGGRLRSLLIEGSGGKGRVLRELPVRKRLQNLRSGLFIVDDERAKDGSLIAVVLRGAGFGHGSGMCQQGAIGMAEQGFSYRDILRHYFHGAEVRAVF